MMEVTTRRSDVFSRPGPVQVTWFPLTVAVQPGGPVAVEGVTSAGTATVSSVVVEPTQLWSKANVNVVVLSPLGWAVRISTWACAGRRQEEDSCGHAR